MAEIPKGFDTIKGNIFPWLLCSVMMSAVVYIYTDSGLNLYAAAAAVMSAVLFMFFDFLRTKKLGGLIYVGVLLLFGIISSSLISGRQNSADFVQWFFSGAQAKETRISFMAAVILFLGFFFTSVIYYFTRAVYRSSAVVLITLVPFALAVKVVVNLPYFYIAAAAALNLFIFLWDSRRNMLKNAKTAGGSAFTVYTDFAVAAVILALIAPKPDTAPFYDQFEEVMNRFQFGMSSTSAVMRGEYYDYSGNADDLRNGESRQLYIINSNDPTYMKSQVFDIYVPESRHWRTLKKSSGNTDWQKTAPLLNYEKFGAAVARAAEENPDLYEKYPFVKHLSNVTEKEVFSVVYARDFPSEYVIAPLRITAAELSNSGAQYSTLSEKGELKPNLALNGNSVYTLRYYSEDIYENGLLESGLCDLSRMEYAAFLKELLLVESYSAEEENVVAQFCVDYISAEKYGINTRTEVSPEIQALADEITAGLEYDCQKARAIEQYFYNNGFVYNAAYSAPEELDTPEYFLFESKTGTCSDFATAYTLMARAAGLNVRYAEGFVPQADTDGRKDVYYIYTENAHAYPEVYIPMAGWVRFEPTIADLNAAHREDRGNGGGTDYLAMLLTAVAVVIGIGVFILLVIITPKIAEGIFRIRVKRSENSKAVKLLYNRYAKILGARLEIDVKPLTPEQLAELSEKENGVSAEPMIKPFRLACYGCGGAENIENADKIAAYEWYKAQLKILKKNKKGKRKGAEK